MNYQPMYNYGMYGNRPQFYPYQYQPQQMQAQQPVQPVQPIPETPIFKQPIGLQGKSVDSVDVVKAMDIPLDGSVSYFPLTDGTAIVTKQLQADGTSKTLVYKPTEMEDMDKLPKYVTEEQFQEKMQNIDVSKEVKEDIKNMKRQIKDISDDLSDLAEEMKERKK